MKKLLLLALVSGCATTSGVAFQEKDLDRLLDERIAAEDTKDEARAAAKDAELKARMQPLAVFISDMSGFSKLTREKGIAWFLAQIRRMERVAEPLMAKHRVELVKQYGDDLFIVSDDPVRLVAFAKEFLEALDVEKAKGNALRVSIGIAKGDVLRVGNDLFGDAVNRASKLGEDMGEAEELLLGMEVFDALSAEAKAGCVVQPEGTRDSKFPFALCTRPTR